MNDNKGYWQRMAKLYGSVMKPDDPQYRKVCDLIKPSLNRDMNVLELACGTGQLSYPLSSKARLWEATDFSPNMIAEAKNQPHSCRLHFSLQDATALPYAPDSFDAVVVSNALHIMPRPDLALQEARRVLKPGGLLFAPTFVWGEGAFSRLWALGLKLTGFKAYHTWTGAGLAAYIEKQGFDVAETVALPDKRTPMCYVAARKERTR